MVKVVASLDLKHLRMAFRCNIALEMAHGMTRNAHRHIEGGDMLCVGEIRATVASSIWRVRDWSMQRQMRDRSMQGRVRAQSL